jgi:hypothetical protein
MELAALQDAVTCLEKTNANLEPELLTADDARKLLPVYVRAVKLASYGQTALTRKLDDAAEVARATGVSMGKAKAALDTATALNDAPEVSDAFKSGNISVDQAAEIARAEQAHPGSATALLEVAHNETFHVLRERARKVVLVEAEQHKGLAPRQHEARRARSHTDELGMIHIDLALEPHVGTPIVNRAEAQAGRLYRNAKKEDRLEPFERSWQTPTRRCCRSPRSRAPGAPSSSSS